MKTTWILGRAVFLLLFSFSSAPRVARASDALATFDCVERLGIGWEATLLTYPVRFPQGAVRLHGARLLENPGVEVPFQFSRVLLYPDGSIESARLSFVAGLKRNASFHYVLEPGAAAAGDPPPRALPDGDSLVLDNGVTALRLLKAGVHRPVAPLRFAPSHDQAPSGDNDVAAGGFIPGPFQGIRLADGSWTGSSCFVAPGSNPGPKVTSYSCEITEQGPVFVEGRIRYEFDNGGSYQWTARLLAGDPAVRIDEQWDLKQLGEPGAWQLLTSLGGGAAEWKPDHALWYSDRGNLPGRDQALEQRLTDLGVDTSPYQESRFASGSLSFAAPAAKVFHLTAWEPWSPAAHYFGLVSGAALARTDPASLGRMPFLGVVPLHVGTWRNAQQQESTTSLVTRAGGEVAMEWPLMAAPHPFTYIQSGEYDPDLPFSFCRRQWALVAGPLRYHEELYFLRRYQGFINLNDYKDWILEWSPDPAVTYPRLILTADDARALAARPETASLAPDLQDLLYVRDSEPRRAALWQRLSNPNYDSSPIGQARAALLTGNASPWFTYYRQAQSAGSAFDLDEFFSSDRIPIAQRSALRSWIAAYCYALTEPDFNPRGSMVHLGNPNMPVNRFLALPTQAALIPDHPMAGRWLDLSAQYIGYKLATLLAPGNAWGESLTYFRASEPHLVQASLVLDKAHRLPASVAQSALLASRFPIPLLSPFDPRFGARSLPNWGHEGSDIPTHWLPAAELARKRNPSLANALAWAWDQLGRPMNDQHDARFSEHLPPEADLLQRLPPGFLPEDLRGQWLPGFGATMRAHAGDPLETFFALRQGYFISHSDANQGDFILFAKGAPLSSLSLFGYGVSSGGPFEELSKTTGWHNVPHFGSKGEAGATGGLFEGVHAFASGASFDYLRSLGDYGPQRWTRQVLFLKGKSAAAPNYFLLRDSARAANGQPGSLQQKWWSLRTVGAKSQVQTRPGEINYVSSFGPGLNVHLFEPEAAAMSCTSATTVRKLDNQAALSWKKAGSPVLEQGQVADVMTVTSAGPIAAGQDIVAALYPFASGESLPRYETLSPGVLRVTSSEATDVVFQSPDQLSFSAGDVAFQGRAGAIRIYPQEVHLILAEGTGSVSYKKAVLRGTGPAEKIVSLGDAEAALVFDIPAPPATLPAPPAVAAGTVEKLARGVLRSVGGGLVTYTFDNPEPLAWSQGEARFRGRRGAIEINEAARTVRFTLLDAGEAAWGAMKLSKDAASSSGPVEATFYDDHVTGQNDGGKGFVYISPPPGLDKLPMLTIDGQAYAPGTHDGVIIVPVMEGPHRWELTRLPQPPIFRKWDQW